MAIPLLIPIVTTAARVLVPIIVRAAPVAVSAVRAAATSIGRNAVKIGQAGVKAGREVVNSPASAAGVGVVKEIGGAVFDEIKSDIYDGVKESFKNYAASERELLLAANDAGAPAEDAQKFLDPILALADRLGVPFDKAFSTFRNLAKQKGNLADAFDNLDEVLTTYQASGVEVTELAVALKTFSADSSKDGDNLQSNIDILLSAGSLGRYEIEDFRNNLGNIAPAAHAAGLVGKEGVIHTASLFEVLAENGQSKERVAQTGEAIINRLTDPVIIKKFREIDPSIDLERNLEIAAKEGLDPIKLFLDSAKSANKIQPGVLLDLFGADEARAIQFLIEREKDRESLEAEIRRRSDGLSEKGARTLSDDNQSSIDRIRNQSVRVGRVVSTVAEPVLDMIVGDGSPVDDMAVASSKIVEDSKREAMEPISIDPTAQKRLIDGHIRMIDSEFGQGDSKIVASSELQEDPKRKAMEHTSIDPMLSSEEEAAGAPMDIASDSSTVISSEIIGAFIQGADEGGKKALERARAVREQILKELSFPNPLPFSSPAANAASDPVQFGAAYNQIDTTLSDGDHN